MNRMLSFVLKHYRQGAFDDIAQVRRTRRFPVWGYAAAVGAAAAVVLLVFLFRSTASVTEYLADGSSVQVELPDGSRLTLSPGSRAKYSASKEGRNVEMEGTALFKVTRDEDRPFRVSAGGSSVEVLGTEFQVKQSRGEVWVDVFEGRVLFSGSEDGVVLTPGMESVLRQGAAAPAVLEDASPNPIAWMTGVFKYDGVSLETVLAELSEYYGREFVAASGPAAKTLTGSFFTDEDPEVIAEAISSALEIDINVR